ncbi:hypothetical protein ACFQE8_04175 [Salinirubellus sp. GCM10025818]|uniref:hypothetical protein n=1 Tax=Salinirubellus TaxID=2162630 RepID=UPI0030CD2423
MYKDIIRGLTSAKGGAAAVTILMLVASVVAPAAMAAPSTGITVQTADDSIDVGETTTFEVVLENANGGVGAYGLTVSLDDASVGTITDVGLGGAPPSSFSDVSISADGSSAEIDAVGADTADSGPVTVVTVTVEGAAAGQTDLSVDVSSVGTEGGVDYAITGVSGASLTVGDGVSTPEPDPATPTPEPATPTPEPDPATPTPEPATPTPEPDPATPTPDPATPTPEPATPTPEPDPATPTPEPDPATPTPEPAPETTLHLGPSSDTVKQGKTTTYDVVVDSADGGVGGAEMAIVVGDTDVATITEVRIMGADEEEVDISEDGSRADLTYTGGDTYDSGSFSIVEVTVEGQSNGETDLSIAPAAGNGEVHLLNEEGTGYDVTGTTGATVSVHSGGGDDAEPTPEPTPEPPADGPDAFQIDLVEGEPIQQLDPDAGETYHKQDRFIVALQITEEERQGGGAGSPMTRTYQADGCEVTYSWLSFDNTTGVSEVAVSVSDAGDCEGITLSYVGYEFPDGTTSWDAEHADEQELKDSMTVTLQPGEEAVLTVDVTPEEPTAASISAPAGIGL